MGFSPEAIVYDTAAHAQTALVELRNAKDHCPTGFTDGPVLGEPATKSEFSVSPDAGWTQVRGVTRLAFDATLSIKTGEAIHTDLVYLVRGRTLVAVYARLPEGLATLTAPTGGLGGFTATMAKRLATQATE